MTLASTVSGHDGDADGSTILPSVDGDKHCLQSVLCLCKCICTRVRAFETRNEDIVVCST